MRRKFNLILASMLLGAVASALPPIAKIIVFSSIVFYLFVGFDFYEYDRRKQEQGRE